MSVPLPCPPPAALITLSCSTGEFSLGGWRVKGFHWCGLGAWGGQPEPGALGCRSIHPCWMVHPPLPALIPRGTRGACRGAGSDRAVLEHPGSHELKGLFLLQVCGFPLGCIHVLPIPRLAADGAPGGAHWGHPQLRHLLPRGPPPQRDHPGRGPAGGWLQHGGYR